MHLRHVLVGVSLAALASACSKPDHDSDGLLIAQITGTAQQPLSASSVKLYKSGKAGYYLAASWESCAPQGAANKSAVIANGAVLIESTNNCSGAQYVTITAQDSIDLSAYAKGSLHFTIEASNAGQSFEFLVQDGTTKTTVPVDLGKYGFDATKTGVAQAVAIPGDAIVTNGIDMAHLKRPFQVNIKCGSGECQTKFDDIRWSGQTVTAKAATEVPTTLALGIMPRPNRCKTQICRPIRYAPIGVVRTSPTGWATSPGIVGVSTNEGAYGFPISIDGGGPAFLVAEDPDSGQNFIAEVPTDDLSENEAGDETVDIDLATTLAAMAQFPGGNEAGADFFEAADAAFLPALIDALDQYFENHPPEAAEFAALLAAALADPAVAKVLNDGRAAVGKPAMDPNTIVASAKGTPPQVVSTGDSGSSTSTSTSTNTSSSTGADGFPSGLPTGTYEMTGTVCVNGTCNPVPAQTMTNTDPAQFEQAVRTSFGQGCAQATEGTTCTVQYGAFDGTKFTATVNITACVDGSCATSSMNLVLTKKS